MSKQDTHGKEQAFQELNEQELKAVTGCGDKAAAKNYLNQLSEADKQEFQIRRDTGVGSQRGDEIYHRYMHLRTGLTAEDDRQITEQVMRNIANAQQKGASSSKR